MPIVGALFIGPMLIIGITLAEFSTAERINPALNRYPPWSDFKVLNWTITWIHVALSICAGWLLLTSFKPFSVRFYIAALWLVGPTTLLLSYLAFLATLGDHFISATDITKVLVQTLVSGTFWTLYFTQSKRVQETYYSLLSDGTPEENSNGSKFKNASPIKSDSLSLSFLSGRREQYDNSSDPSYRDQVDEEKLRLEIVEARKARRQPVDLTNRKQNEEMTEAVLKVTENSVVNKHSKPEGTRKMITGDSVTKHEAKEKHMMFSPIYDGKDPGAEERFDNLLKFSKESKSIISLLAIYPDINERSRLIERLIERSAAEVLRELEKLNQDLIDTINISDDSLKNDVLEIIKEIKETSPMQIRRAVEIANQLGDSLNSEAFREEFLLGRSNDPPRTVPSQSSLKQTIKTIKESNLSGPQIVEILNNSGVPARVTYEKGFGQYSIDFGSLSAQDLSYQELKEHLSKSFS